LVIDPGACRSPIEFFSWLIPPFSYSALNFYHALIGRNFLKTIDVATCFDARALYAAAALIASLRRRARRRPVRLFAVVPFESEELRYIAKASRTTTFEVVVLPVVNTYASVPTRENITAATYLRHQLPEVLSDLHKVIYVDSDTLINADLTQLFDTDISRVLLAAVPDFAQLLGSLEWHDYRAVYEGEAYKFRDYIEKVLKIGDLASLPYFNAGVLFMNLDEWRKQQLGERVMRFVAEHELKFPDQDSLNRHVAGNFVRLDARWNAQAPCAKRRAPFFRRTFREKQTDWDVVRHLWFRHPWILHFAGANKPWIATDPATPLDAIWWRFAASSPLAWEIENDYLAERRAAGIENNKIPSYFRQIRDAEL
jgi:lipopolysaccharide biosynthesis glycosyltransferase